MDIQFGEKQERLETAVARLLRDEPGFFAIAVHDLHTNQLWQFHSQPMRSASLIKLFIMAEAFAQIDAGQLNPSALLAFAESDRVGGAGLLQDLRTAQVGGFGGKVGIHDATAGGGLVFYRGAQVGDGVFKAALHRAQLCAVVVDDGQGLVQRIDC